LEDHLLLVAGHFNRTRVWQSAIGSGSTSINYKGHELLEIRPFKREHRSMPDVRWMAILNNRVLVFGVPNLVARALAREERGQPADPILLQRLGQLHPDVNSWSIIAVATPVLARHMAPHIFPASLETILKDADEVELGIHYGRSARIDFSVHTGNDDFAKQLFDNAQVVLASFTRDTHSHLQVETDDQHRIHGSVTVREKLFDQWLAAVERSRSRIQELQTGEQ
jgi:hypothetical protein